MLHGSETWSLKRQNELALHRVDIRMRTIRWRGEVKLKDKLSCIELRQRLRKYVLIEREKCVTLDVECARQRYARKNMERGCGQGYERYALKTEWCRGAFKWMEMIRPVENSSNSHSHGDTMSVNCTFLVPACSGWPGLRAVKRVCLLVVVILH